jgi:hypothetical protein
MIKQSNIILVFIFICQHLIGQELGYESSFSLGSGIAIGNIRAANSDFLLQDQEVREVIQNYGSRTGWVVSTQYFNRINRSLGIVFDAGLMHSRRRGEFIREYFKQEVISNQLGVENFSNINLQVSTQLRLQFGTFKRFYSIAGPYLDQNLLNFSSIQFDQTNYFSSSLVGEEVVLERLESPTTISVNERTTIQTRDFGAILGLGTLLALPGNNLIQLEFKYSRGAFRLSENAGMRQNRFIIWMAYTMVYPVKTGYQKYMPFE